MNKYVQSPTDPVGGFNDIAGQRIGDAEYDSGNAPFTVTDLVSAAWRQRGILVGGAMLGALVGAAIALIFYFTSPKVMEHFIALPGLSHGKYPNGTAFSPQDLLSPQVNSTVGSEIGIDEPEALRRALSATFTSPLAEGITVKYQSQLATRGLSSAEIQEINQRFLQEMQSTSRNYVRLSVDLGDVGISEAQARDLLVRIPKTWSKTYTTRFRVIDDQRLPGSKIELTEPIDTAVGAIAADRSMDVLREGLNVIRTDNRLSALQTDAGANAADLLKRIDLFDDVFLSPIITNRLSQNEFLATYYVDNFRLQIDEIDTELASIRETIDDIKGIMAQSASIAAEVGNGNNTTGLEISGSALGDIVSLANRASLAGYLTGLLDRQQSLVAKKAELNTRIKRISSVENAVIDFSGSAQDRFDSVIAEYNELLEEARRLLRAEYVTLYRPLGQPLSVTAISLKDMALIAFTGLILALLAAALFVMLAPMFRGQPSRA